MNTTICIHKINNQSLWQRTLKQKHCNRAIDQPVANNINQITQIKRAATMATFKWEYALEEE